MFAGEVADVGEVEPHPASASAPKVIDMQAAIRIETVVAAAGDDETQSTIRGTRVPRRRPIMGPTERRYSVTCGQ